MLAGFPGVRRWEETDDIVQESMMRLHTRLRQFQPESPLHAQRMIALQIRRQLLDLSRRYSRKSHHAASYETRNGDPGGTAKYASLEEWHEFHQQVDRLPEAARETFELAWYVGMAQEEIATELGISLRQVQRRWRTARILLARSVCMHALLDDG